jgi:hypothetical protein
MTKCFPAKLPVTSAFMRGSTHTMPYIRAIPAQGFVRLVRINGIAKFGS